MIFHPKVVIIGEAKYRAMALARGFILAEFDHDDYLTPNATQMIFDASNAYPDATFITQILARLIFIGIL